jgi:lactate permease
MAWTQNYQPVLDNLGLSALAAALPLFVLAYALGVRRTAAWKASAYALAAALVVACLIARMPLVTASASAVYGAVFGLWAIGWMVYAAILLFDIVVASGRFDDIRRSLAEVSPDPRIQALLIAFAFGAFIEGASGAGTPVAVSAALLAGLGFPPLLAGGICLLANTAPVAFGALGLPVVTLSIVTELPQMPLSAAVGRICPIVGLIIPAYLILVLSGRRGLKPVWPAVAVAGVTFATAQFLVANFMGPQLADILSALATIVAMLVLLRVWQPADVYRLPNGAPSHVASSHLAPSHLAPSEVLRAWMPYLLLVVLVLLWGAPPVQRYLDQPTLRLSVPGLHNVVQRLPPVVDEANSYPAVFVFNWLGANGTACFLAAVLAALLSGLGVRGLLSIMARTARRLALPELAIALLMSLAYVMNYAGTTATLGLALSATGPLFAFFSAYLGWLGVFLTGSDTSSNALFGNLQVVSARALGLNPILMAAVNTCGGVMGKMISVASIAVAAAATGMPTSEESKLFRFTFWHSVLLTAAIGLVSVLYAYGVPSIIPTVSAQAPPATAVVARVTAGDRPNAFHASPDALDARGFVEEEFFVAGTANGAPYKTRFLVRRPVDPKRFNGTVVVEWLNAALGYDLELGWPMFADLMTRDGYVWVGISALPAGAATSPGCRRTRRSRRAAAIRVTSGRDVVTSDRRLSRSNTPAGPCSTI